MDFYIPKTRTELISWLNAHYWGTGKRHGHMKKAQLMAIYLNIRHKKG